MEQEVSVRLWSGIWNPGKEVLLGTAGWGLRGIRGHVLTGIPDTGVASGIVGRDMEPGKGVLLETAGQGLGVLEGGGWCLTWSS